MEQPYYKLLPKEARLQLLIEADYFTILELCNDPLFKEICDSEILWEEKLKRDFDIEVDKNAKYKYLKQYRNKLWEELTAKDEEIANMESEIEEKFRPLSKEENEQIKKIREEFKNKREHLRKKLRKEYEWKKNQKEFKKLQDKFQKLKIDLKPAILYVTKENFRSKDLEKDFSKNGREIDSVTIDRKSNVYTIQFPYSRDAEEVKEEFKDKYKFL